MGYNLFLRNLAKCGQTITLQNRDIVAPVAGSPDFDELFSGDADVTAIVQTQRGKVLFDGVGTDQPITHKFCLEYGQRIAIDDLTRALQVATAKTTNAHGLSTGATVTITGADNAEYNITATVTVTAVDEFEYTIAGTPPDEVGTNAVASYDLSDITAESWILFGGKRFDVLDVEDCGEKNICLVLRCTERGTGNAAKA